MKPNISYLESLNCVNDVYDDLSKYLKKFLPNSICVLIQLDEKQNEAYVSNLTGINNYIFKQLVKILGINPLGKRFKNTEYGKKHFYSTKTFQQFQGSLFEFADGIFPEWLCKSLEIFLDLKNIYYIALSNENVLIGTVLVFPRGNDIANFNKVEKAVDLYSKYIKEIIESLKRDILGVDMRDYFSQSVINNINHEIRTPLNAIVGLLNTGIELLNKDEYTKELTSSIWNNSQQLTKKLDNLLLISDLQSNSSYFNIKSIDLGTIENEINNVVKEFRNNYAKRVINFSTNISKLPCSDVSVDLYYLKIMVEELVSNALKFSTNDISVNLNAAENIEIVIFDEGIGMIESKIGDYMKIFCRNTQKDILYEGIGIGLSIVHHIVIKHKWHININSEPNMGTSVSITLGKNNSDKKNKPTKLNTIILV